MPREKTGIDGLDFVLDGGIQIADGGTRVLIEGVAGTGKTMLALQLASTWVKRHEKEKAVAIYYTREQLPAELVQMAADFRFWGLSARQVMTLTHAAGLVGVRGPCLIIKRYEEGQPGLPDHTQCHLVAQTIGNDIKALQPSNTVGMVVFDGLQSLGPGPLEETDRRDFYTLTEVGRSLHDENHDLVLPMLVLITEKRAEDEVAAEEFMADVVVEMTPGEKRRHPGVMNVKKTRNQKSFAGRHDFDIKDTGIVVYPSLESQVAWVDGQKAVGIKKDEEYVSTGVEGIDRKLKTKNTGPGLKRGTATLLYGPPGTYKTHLATVFLAEGAAKGENTLLVSFKVDKGAVDLITKRHLAGRVKANSLQRITGDKWFVDARDPFELPTSVFDRIKKAVERGQPTLKRAVIYGTTRLRKLPSFEQDPFRFLEALVKYLTRMGISVILIGWPEQPDLQPLALDLCAYELETQILEVNHKSTVRLYVKRNYYDVLVRDPHQMELTVDGGKLVATVIP